MKREEIVSDSEGCVESKSVLDEIVRQGAQKMLQAALDAEVEAFLARHKQERDEKGCRVVVKNGHLPSRSILTGAGPLEVNKPRVRDRRNRHEERVEFSSSILPKYLRRSKNLDELIPWLYLKGISTSDFSEALQALVGEGAKGLSAPVVAGLSRKWVKEQEQWSRRDLSEKQYVYFWADGVYFNIRLEEDRQCILVLMAATADGKKELLGIQDGYRESEQSWHELLTDLKQRGLRQAPKVAVGDGALGFWAAVGKVFPSTRWQRCWMHKTGNILNKMPKGVQRRAKGDLHEIWMAETKEEAYKAFDTFLEKYGAKYPSAVACLKKDKDHLLTFYDFPAEHWIHLRTTNPIESMFSTVRLRHRKTKGSGSRVACLAMVYKLAQTASKNWRRLNQPALLLQVLAGVKFKNGVMVERNAA